MIFIIQIILVIKINQILNKIIQIKTRHLILIKHNNLVITKQIITVLITKMAMILLFMLEIIQPTHQI